MISKETIDKVFELARVEEVIADFVVLKKSGANHKGLSPFTNEKTPSFIVSPAKQIWKDFSSGKGGNVIAFLMEHEHFNYPESIKYIAKKQVPSTVLLRLHHTPILKKMKKAEKVSFIIKTAYYIQQK